MLPWAVMSLEVLLVKSRELKFKELKIKFILYESLNFKENKSNEKCEVLLTYSVKEF